MTSPRPNPLIRAVARMAVSIRTKLMVAFLAVTLLLVGLAVSGLSVLSQANDRTERLIRDQERISTYWELYGYLGDALTIAHAAGFDPELAERNLESIASSAGVILRDRIADYQLFLAQQVRRFGGRETLDGQRLWQLRERMKQLQPLADRIRDLRGGGDLEAVRVFAVQDFAPVALRIQRDVYTTIQRLESDMAERARVTAAAYGTSRGLVIGTALAAVGFALLLGYAFSSSILWPLRRVGIALETVARGNFGQQVTVPNRDELGTLAQNVNVTSRKLGALYEEVEAQRAELAAWSTELERKVADQVDVIERTNRLRRFLPKQVADLVMGAGEQEDLLRSRRDTVTVLFADLRGFTAFANAVPPEQVIGALNAFHAMAGPLIEAHGGTLERFLGDGLMVLFNAPLPHAAPVESAADVAREMQAGFRSAMAPYQAETHPLGLGVGIASGLATLGRIGFEGRLDYAAIGPAPNLAARLCDRAAAGQVLVCETTARRLGEEDAPAGPFELKGIGRKVQAYALV